MTKEGNRMYKKLDASSLWKMINSGGLKVEHYRQESSGLSRHHYCLHMSRRSDSSDDA